MEIQMRSLSIPAIILVFAAVLVGFANIALANEIGGHEHEHHFDFSLPSLVRPLGICALSSLSITFLTGLFRRKLSKHFLKIHKTFAWLTVAFGLSHGILVLVLF